MVLYVLYIFKLDYVKSGIYFFFKLYNACIQYIFIRRTIADYSEQKIQLSSLTIASSRCITISWFHMHSQGLNFSSAIVTDVFRLVVESVPETELMIVI